MAASAETFFVCLALILRSYRKARVQQEDSSARCSELAA
jgi:hypothetical protein